MTYRTGILKRGKRLWACLKRLIPTLNIFRLHLTRPQSSLIICKRSRNDRGRPSTASAARASLDRVSLVNINRRRRDDCGRVSTCVQSNLLRAKTAVSPRSLLRRNDCFRRLWNLHVRLLLVSDHLPETTTYPNWNFPSESLQLQLVNDHLS